MQLGFESINREAQLASLSKCVSACDLCPRMSERTRVLSSMNGNVESKVLFVAEAPGRLGADRTAVPLCGDVAGDNFERLLGQIGWKRDWVFITNALLCNPRQDNGNNSTPTPAEIDNCSEFLRMTINLVRPEVIVSLGATALKALGLIHRHSYSLRTHVGRAVGWRGHKLFIAYHTGQRATMHRSRANQVADFYKLSKIVHPLTGLKVPPATQKGRTKTLPDRLRALYHVVTFTSQYVGELAKFKLVKLLYLADLAASEALGTTITGVTYLRQQDGPWLPDIDRMLNYMEGHEVDMAFRRSIPFVRPGPDPRIRPSLSDDCLRILVEVCAQYGRSSNASLKSAAYRTKPMKEILRAEQTGESRLNTVVLK